MKTLGRILIILTAFALVMGITYAAVNTGTAGTSSNSSRLEPGERPAFQNGERPEIRGERGGNWMYGAIKNIGIVAIIVALIVFPKGWLQNRKRIAQMNG